MDKERCALAKKILEDFLARNPDVKGDAFVCSHDEWIARGEQYGARSYATLVIDSSPLFDVINGYTSSDWSRAVDKDLQESLEASGFYYEPAMAWAICIYDI